MANNFPKEVVTAFDDMVAGFEDMLVISREVEVYNLPGGPSGNQRMSDKIWRPKPFNPAVYDGFDQTSNFLNITQLAVPVSVGQHKSVNMKLSSKDGRDPATIKRYFDGGAKTLASTINQSVFAAIVNNGSLVSKRTTGATGYDDLADAGAMMTEQGIPLADRKIFYSARDYLAMAGTIAKPATSDSPLARSAYERAYVKTVGNFDVFENDQSLILPAKAGVTVTITNATPLYYTPVGSTVDSDGNTTNVDNRYQTITIGVSSGTVAAGDAFTIAGVNSVHQVSKKDTGQLKTFRITKILTGAGGAGTVQITPPIISNGGSTKAEAENQNVTAAPTNGAAITFLNTVSKPANPFFVKGAVELIPGTFAVDPDDGWQMMKATTPVLGIPLIYVQKGSILDLSVQARLDGDYGVGILDTEKVGIQLFNQT